MTLLQANQLSVRVAEDLFADLSFTLNAGDRLGIVAPNGRGKSTLLSILAGVAEPTTGSVQTARGATVGLMEQAVGADLLSKTMHQSVLERLPKEEQETGAWQVDALLAEFDTPEDMLHRPVSALSGGWQRVMLLARAWIARPDILLLDEPTNHLDLEKILQLETWMGWALGDTPVVIASHDRAFLDNATTATLFVRPKVSRYFGLSYGPAKDALAELDEADARKQQNDLKEVKRLRQNAAKLTNIGINSGSDLLTVKAKQLKERASKIEENLIELHKDKTGEVKLSNSGTHAKVLVSLENVSVGTPDGRQLFQIDKQFIFQGDRIVLLGRNGTGKSRLITALNTAICTPEANTVAGLRATPSVALAYMDQSLSFVPDDATPVDYIGDQLKGGLQRVRAILANAGFNPTQQDMRIGRLSFGQKSRLGLVALRLAHPNFYLLDEPTNHIDIPGQEALEDELLEQGVTCVLVSHDRQFVREVGTRFWEIANGRIIERDEPETFFDSLSA